VAERAIKPTDDGPSTEPPIIIGTYIEFRLAGNRNYIGRAEKVMPRENSIYLEL